MMRYRWLVAGAVVALVVMVGVWVLSNGRGSMAVDLIERLPAAKQRRPNPEVFTVADVTIGGETRRSIVIAPLGSSRIIWEEAIPPKAWLHFSIALKEEAWTKTGDGVLFRAAVSHAGRYDELVNIVINPFGNPGDRQWHDLMLDVSPYGGQTVEIIFNTSAGVGSANFDSDFAVWGAPRVVVR